MYTEGNKLDQHLDNLDSAIRKKVSRRRMLRTRAISAIRSAIGGGYAEEVYRSDHLGLKTFEKFISEAAWKGKKKQGVTSKPGVKSGREEVPKNIKMIGLPGSGKSTMAHRIAKITGGTATGYDDARDTIHGTRSNQSGFPAVHALTMKRLKDADKSKPRILDNTNVNPNYKKGVDHSLEHEADMPNATPVSPGTKQKTSMRRNRGRGENAVPKRVMNHMARGERATRKTKEGKEAIKNGRKLTKQLRLNKDV